MISALSFIHSKRAFRPWDTVSTDPVETFRAFTRLIEKSVEKSAQDETGTGMVLPLKKAKKQAVATKRRSRRRSVR